ncbi:MAG: hypothetical protein EOM22_02750 [Gammaproteobacteria bacterium]|jgi:hypothetical protein|nr:hypothetical protein [Gammaproteobacteria bacterium]
MKLPYPRPTLHVLIEDMTLTKRVGPVHSDSGGGNRALCRRPGFVVSAIRVKPDGHTRKIMTIVRHETDGAKLIEVGYVNQQIFTFPSSISNTIRILSVSEYLDSSR